MSSRAAPQVAVLMGGPSAEREVSLSTGHECAAALREAGFEVSEIDPGHEGGAALAARLAQLPKGAVIFNALHGRWGEDGCVQGLLEWMGLPYTHSGVLASALAMDKERAKLALRGAGIRVCDSVIASREDVRARHVLPPPYVVKPANEGSSVGVYIVQSANDAPPQLDDNMPAQVMVETYAPGRELTVAVMGAPGEERAFCVTEIVTEGWYDYDAKYKVGGSRHVLPADVPQEITDLCLDWAVRAHVALGCRGLSRSDFRWDMARGAEGLICLETNTQPGMTPTSLAPEQAAYCGVGFADLCRWLVEDASCMR